MSDAVKKAQEFLSRERAFRLGELLTESSHPKTKTLSQTAEDDLPAAIRLLQSVDDDIPPAMKKALQQDSFHELVDAFGNALSTGKRIYFTGCGATGRLSILLESAWRRFWGKIKVGAGLRACPGQPHRVAPYVNGIRDSRDGKLRPQCDGRG